MMKIRVLWGDRYPTGGCDKCSSRCVSQGQRGIQFSLWSMLLSSVLIPQLCMACTSTPILMSILPGWPCYGVCALLIHPGVWSPQRGNSFLLDRLAEGDETHKHTERCVPGCCNLLPLEPPVSGRLPTRAPVSVEPVKVEARVTGRPRAPAVQVWSGHVWALQCRRQVRETERERLAKQGK